MPSASLSHRQNRLSGRERYKLAYRARSRLLSIDRDSVDLKQRILSTINVAFIAPEKIRSYPWLPNKNCGSWYLEPDDESSASNVYFKSTDGHVGTYSFSLKRLNLPLLNIVHKYNGCFLVDSSVRKILPDSFSRTIPIWCCVLNRIVLKYRRELQECLDLEGEWDTRLYTPDLIVSEEEHSTILDLIDSRVDILYRSKAIVNPKKLVETLIRPIRAMWTANGQVLSDNSRETHSWDRYYILICCNPSLYNEQHGTRNHTKWIEDSSSIGYFYTPGAADDESSWGRGLVPELFWANKTAILDPSLDDDGVDLAIDSITRNNNDDSYSNTNSKLNMNKIGNLNIWIGSRKAGRPPDCFDRFDCILNVTENNYPEMQQFTKSKQGRRFYLQLPVLEGKRDKTELERLMPVGILFLAIHLRKGRRILVHCAQGKDRSVAVVLAFASIFCVPEYPLRLRSDTCFGIESKIKASEQAEEEEVCLLSGIQQATFDRLVKPDGRDIFLRSIHQLCPDVPDRPLANKESLRIMLHLISQYRENAEPTRSTMQKLNRFFMSSPMYRKDIRH